MRFFQKVKDGGPESPVDAYFLIEIKWLFSIALLKFNVGTREAYHTNAFNAWTWFLRGWLREFTFDSATGYVYTRSLLPKFTPREKNHKVVAGQDSWCLTFRGPWSEFWTETSKVNNTVTVFTHGRKIVTQTKLDRNVNN